ncbi:MAG: SDR family oxidoreductase [Bacteroidetes bacterium]|nr:MAG: SDR family oxidoreductase [Bacteroidota bacterium]
MNFKNKRVWITGASSGIGEAVAYAFARQAAHLVLSARSATVLHAVADKCVALGAAKAVVVCIDVANEDMLSQLAANYDHAIGPVDILINSSGISQRSVVMDTSMAVYKQLMAVNYLGSVAITKMVLPGMVKQGSGHIVAISSVSGKLGAPLRSGYSASKHALHGFFDCLRSEVTHLGLKVLLVCPGYINTNISVNALNAQGQPTGKMDDNQANGMMPEVLADRILRAIQKGKREINVGGKEVIGIYLKRFLPGLLAKILQKQAAKQAMV